MSMTLENSSVSSALKQPASRRDLSRLLAPLEESVAGLERLLSSSFGELRICQWAVLSQYLLEPALQAAEKFVPRNRLRRIDGFNARRGVIYQTYNGILQAVPGLKPSPFEITFETPQKAPLHLQVEAVSAALQTILLEYRYLMAVAQNI